jgi:hypothetical protein
MYNYVQFCIRIYISPIFGKENLIRSIQILSQSNMLILQDFLISYYKSELVKYMMNLGGS